MKNIIIVDTEKTSFVARGNGKIILNEVETGRTISQVIALVASDSELTEQQIKVGLNNLKNRTKYFTLHTKLEYDEYLKVSTPASTLDIEEMCGDFEVNSRGDIVNVETAQVTDTFIPPVIAESEVATKKISSPKTALTELSLKLSPVISLKLNKNHLRMFVGKYTAYIYSTQKGFKLALENNSRARMTSEISELLSKECCSKIWEDTFSMLDAVDVFNVASYMAAK